MAHTFKIKGVETVFIQSANDYQVEVAVEIYEDEVLTGERRFGYPTDTTAEFIKEDLAKLCTTLDSDKAIGEASAELEARLANADSIKESLMSE